MTDVGKFWTGVLLGVAATVIAGFITGQILTPFLFGVYAVVIAIVCITVESIGRKTLAAFLVGAVPTAIYYFVSADQFAWIFFCVERLFYVYRMFERAKILIVTFDPKYGPLSYAGEPFFI